MADLRFTKMHGIGNDYVYIDTWEQAEPAIGWTQCAIRVSDRRFGLGGDGMILIERPLTKGADGRMRMFNADGSESEMCGNGLRCVARFLHDKRYKGRDELRLDTGAGCLGVKIVERDDMGEAQKIQINMGLPILNGPAIPCTGTSEGRAGTIQVEGLNLEYTAVSMGNPHCIIFVDDVENFPVHQIGPKIENNTVLFPRRVNVEFVQVISRSEVRQRTWERGSGETLACGTGASAVGVAGQLRGLLDGDILNHLAGGDLRIQWQGLGTPVIMTGGATYVGEGVVHPSLLKA
jgi:diaminopimelate epimerase